MQVFRFFISCLSLDEAYFNIVNKGCQSPNFIAFLCFPYEALNGR